MEPATAIISSYPTSQSPDHSLREDESANSSPVEQTPTGKRDLEKELTNDDARNGIASGRISCLESLTRRNTREGTFSHPLSHVKTLAENLVDFDGEDDLYRPINWPFRKVITTLLYRLTTMGSSWANSL